MVLIYNVKCYINYKYMLIIKISIKSWIEKIIYYLQENLDQRH